MFNGMIEELQVSSLLIPLQPHTLNQGLYKENLKIETEIRQGVKQRK